MARRWASTSVDGTHPPTVGRDGQGPPAIESRLFHSLTRISKSYTTPVFPELLIKAENITFTSAGGRDK